LGFIVGQWKGTGYVEYVPGKRRTFIETENVQSKLGGLVVLFEGVGKDMASAGGPEATVHSALAAVSYDDQAKVFRWRAYQMDRDSVHSIDSDAKVENQMIEWGFQDGRGSTIRFIINLNEKGEWFEIGERSQDGKTWQKFFEMTLQRIG